MREDLRILREELRAALDGLGSRVPGGSGAPEIPPAESALPGAAKYRSDTEGPFPGPIDPGPDTERGDTQDAAYEDALDNKGVAVKEEPRIIL
jgi:hypothetical protein